MAGERQLRIGLDIDGVVADSFPVFLRKMNEFFGKDLATIDNYNMAELYGVDWETMSKFFDDHIEYLYSEPLPMPGALQGITKLLDKGHEIVYVTARNPGIEEEVTLKWMNEKSIPFDKIVFMGNACKTTAVKEYDLNVFVEDHSGNALKIFDYGIDVFLFDAPYNKIKLPQGITRCYNWSELTKEITLLDDKIF